MLVHKYFLAVTLILLTSKTAQAYILLTANVADIKKIAGKFVSEDLADQLAHSVAAIINNMNNRGAIDVERSKMNNADQKFKNEDNEINDMLLLNRHAGDQQRFKKETRTPEAEYTSNDNIYKNNPQAQTTKYLNNWELNLKAQETNKYTMAEDVYVPANSEMKQIFNQDRPAQHYNNIRTRTTRKPIQYTIRTTRHKYLKYESMEQKPRNVPESNPVLDPEMMELNQKIFANNPYSDSKRYEQRDDYKLSPVDNDQQYANNNRGQSNENTEFYNKETQRAAGNGEIGLVKHDNLNVKTPKVDYIATSGVVALPAPTATDKKWWEKEFTNRR